MFVRSALFAFALFVGSTRAQDDKAHQWAEQIVLRAKFFKKEDTTGTRRWEKSPKLSVFGGSTAQRKAADGIFKQINEVLKGTPIKKIEVGKPNDSSADIMVHLVTRQQMPNTAADVFGGVVAATTKRTMLRACVAVRLRVADGRRRRVISESH